MSNQCVQCGNCCTVKNTDRIPIDRTDITRWIEKKAYHLFTVDMMKEWNCFGITGKYNEKGTCPFLSKNIDVYECSIQDLKPKVCREFKAGADYSIKYCDCHAIVNEMV